MQLLQIKTTKNDVNQYIELIKLFLHTDDFRVITEDSDEIPDKVFEADNDKNKFKREIYNYLSMLTGDKPKWGILTGIRPVKLAGELYEKMQNRDAVKQYLNDEYLMSDEKAELILDMYEYQQEKLGKPPVNSAGVYIGIPFCPTRCLYCSFTSNPYSEERSESYLEALFKEIAFVGDGMKKDGITAESIYIGGGTPTSLNAEQLDRLLTHIENHFDFSNIREYTVEAGRPDTITGDKLKVLLEHGVERISVNPQTMHDKTLETIGRAHTVRETRDAFKLANEYNIPVVNADLIAGLPDESAEDFISTLNEVMEFGPSNITLHTLAVKRSSRLKELDDNFHRKHPQITEEMLTKAKSILADAGYKPYYLYRQKNIAGSTENIGYCKDDTLSLYNVRIMEEAQSIIALGAGGITKVYYPEENRLERVPNVSNYEIYIERIDEMLERKQKNLFRR